MFDTRRMMTLRQYLSANPGKTHQQWAAELGISRSHFTQIASGSALPGRRLMVRIADVTGGAVPVTAWFDTPEAAE